jgi:pyruvate-formate lyase
LLKKYPRTRALETHVDVLTTAQKTSTDNEVIVELQTYAPLKGAIMPNGGRRMALSSLKTYAMTRPVGRGRVQKVSHILRRRRRFCTANSFAA